ncbi:MAG: circularly permuted type 2 ATP-grasp protein [Planctomycetota bacterium]
MRRVPRVELHADSALTFLDYQASGGHYDAALDASRDVRPGWSRIRDWIDAVGSEGLDQRSRQMQQAIRDNGATFTVEGDPTQQSRPWKLAVVPYLIDASAWSNLEAGLRQRTRLLESILDDLLGPQRLIQQRVLPPELLWANPNFRRSYHRLPVMADEQGRRQRLIVSATDVARSSDGNWLVTGDRTRAPSGLGYLLENRVVTTQVLSQLARSCNVRRLAGFFFKLRQRIQTLAPRMRDNPRVALLTPGPQSYRYFEDAYLARYLGYNLVQGSDLAVRGERLNLKTLGGLMPIEVLWRHVSDHKCDPLELDPNSIEGVTGLLRTVRSGVVAIANSIGSEMAQMPALAPFLPAACKFLFSEELLLPNLDTYWCGGEKERRFVLDNLDDLVIRDAFTINETPPRVVGELSEEQKRELRQRIENKPFSFVAHRRMQHATTPVWADGALKSWHVSLRTFQVGEGDNVEVLPGGLARVSASPNQLLASPTAGQLTVDCWVTDPQPDHRDLTLLPDPTAQVPIVRTGDEMPSRVAEHLYWLGRYVERCESIARLLRTTLKRLADDSTPSKQSATARLIAALAGVGQIPPDHAIEEFDSTLPEPDIVLPGSVFSRSEPQGLQRAAMAMVYNATTVRDRLSIDAYRILQRVSDELSIAPPTQTGEIGPAIERLNRLIFDLLAFAGLTAESMTRTHTYLFLQLGRRIERTHQMGELIATTLVGVRKNDRSLCEAVLETSDSLMTYHSRYMNVVRPDLVLDLLVTDDTNPRSIAFQLRDINTTLDSMPRENVAIGLQDDRRLAREMLHHLEMTQAGVFEANSDGKRTDLQDWLDKIISELPKLSDAVAAQFFFHTSATQLLTGATEAEDAPDLTRQQRHQEEVAE